MRCTVTALLLTLTALATLPGCASWFFSGEEWVDRSRPVVLLETTGGVEFGAATEFGILSLGNTATEGACRVRYFLGPTPLVESGELGRVSGSFVRARIDLKTQMARALDRSPRAEDELWVMWTPDGERVERVRVDLATGDGLAGDLLLDPGVELPGGATLLCRGPKQESLFVGLIAGTAEVDLGPTSGRYYVFAGVDRVREMLAIPTDYPVDMVPKFRPDGITVLEPAAPAEPPTPPTPQPAGGGQR